MRTTGAFLVVSAGLLLLLLSGVTPGLASDFNNPTTTDSLGNTAGGSNALFFTIETGDCGVTAGCFNTAFGGTALTNNMVGSNNTAMGLAALQQNTNSDNTAVGSLTLSSNNAGNFNTAVGSQALSFNTAGKKNTAVGAGALAGSSGSQNIAIGFQAGHLLSSGNNNIYLASGGGASGESLTMRLGSVQNRAFIAGVKDTGVAGTMVLIDSSGQLGVPLSSARYKRDIVAVGARSEAVLQLRPVTFSYKEEAPGVVHYGLIAEEVAAVYPELVTRTAMGEAQTVRYHELIPLLLNQLQRQQQILEQQQRELTELRATLSPSR